MSITLKLGAAVTAVLNRARVISNGFAFQKLGTSFKDALLLNATQTVGKTNTAKTRWATRVPYTYVDSQGKTLGALMYVNVEVTAEESCPFTVIEQAPHILGAIAVEPQFLAHIRDRVQPS